MYYIDITVFRIKIFRIIMKKKNQVNDFRPFAQYAKVENNSEHQNYSEYQIR